MNAKTFLSCLLPLTAILLLAGCGEQNNAPAKVVAAELDQLVNEQEQTAKQQKVLEGIFSADEKNERTDEELTQTFSLFFKDFNYEILDTKIEKDTARVEVELTTIDATALAKDYISLVLLKQIQGSATPSSVTYAGNDYYHSLYIVLSNNEYSTVTSSYTFTLNKTDSDWQIVPDPNFENVLTGGFVTAVSDPNLFTPEEIATIYFDTIKSFDKEQMNQFLSLDTLFAADAEYKRTISQALTEQILQHFDYKILSSSIEGNIATVSADITSYDANSIVQGLSGQMSAYNLTSQALEDGIEGRVNKAIHVLIEEINQNTTSATNTITLTLTNDGIGWKLNMDKTLAQAILGDIQSALANLSTSSEGENN